MGGILPEGELVRRAAAWICSEKETRPEKKLCALLDEAGMRFNLSPKDQHMLAELFTRNDSPSPSPNSGRPL